MSSDDVTLKLEGEELMRVKRNNEDRLSLEVDRRREAEAQEEERKRDNEVGGVSGYRTCHLTKPFTMTECPSGDELQVRTLILHRRAKLGTRSR